MLKAGFVLIFMMAAGFAGSPVLAEPDSVDRERAAIEAFLKKEGYVSWEEIDLRGDTEEADDYGTAKAPEYEIDLEPETLRIMRTDRRFVAATSASEMPGVTTSEQ